MERTETCVVADAGPIIHLDELEKLWILRDFKTVLLPPSVLEEVRKHREEIVILDNFRIEPVKRMSADQLDLLYHHPLHRGELDALSLVAEHPDSVFLTDDQAARLAAEALDFRVHGTLGVLIRALRTGSLSKNEVLHALHSIETASSLHIRRTLLDMAIQQVERVTEIRG
jgi:predicted nucleic acid-binding protein